MKKYLQILAMGLILAVMSGCGGPSEEKIKEVQSVYSQLVDRHNEVIDLYADIMDASLSQNLDEMADEINSIGQQDVKELSDSQIDEIISELQEYITTYDSILSSIDEITDEEITDDTFSVSVTIKNNTGVELDSLYLYKASQDDKGKNLVEDITQLGPYESLSILNIYMTEEDTVWHLEALEDSGKVIQSEDVDFSSYKDGKVTIQMEFSFDKMEGWLTVE